MTIAAVSNSINKSATLRRGQRFEMAGRRWRVIYVNASRAHCEAVVREPVTIRGRTFQATRRIALDISANAGVELLAELEARS
jgi:hypothetical protein